MINYQNKVGQKNSSIYFSLCLLYCQMAQKRNGGLHCSLFSPFLYTKLWGKWVLHPCDMGPWMFHRTCLFPSSPFVTIEQNKQLFYLLSIVLVLYMRYIRKHRRDSWRRIDTSTVLSSKPSDPWRSQMFHLFTAVYITTLFTKDRALVWYGKRLTDQCPNKVFWIF